MMIYFDTPLHVSSFLCFFIDHKGEPDEGSRSLPHPRGTEAAAGAAQGP